MFKLNLKETLNNGKKKMLKPFLETFMPGILQHIKNLNQTKENGGLRKEEEDAIVLMLVPIGEDVYLTISPVNFTDKGSAILHQPIQSHSINEVIANGFDLEKIQPTKDEEE